MGSPELITALAIAGDLSFNPLTDTLTNNKGEQVKLDAPTGDELPAWIFDVDDDDNYDENSSLLQELEIDLNLIYK